MADDDTDHHLAQTRQHYLEAVWSGQRDAAEIYRVELEALERRRPAPDPQP